MTDIEINTALAEDLRIEKAKRDKLEEELKEMERDPLIRKFLDLRFRHKSAGNRISVLYWQLGHWAFHKGMRE